MSRFDPDFIIRPGRPGHRSIIFNEALAPSPFDKEPKFIYFWLRFIIANEFFIELKVRRV
jgi:hypothetical protein